MQLTDVEFGLLPLRHHFFRGVPQARGAGKNALPFLVTGHQVSPGKIPQLHAVFQ